MQQPGSRDQGGWNVRLHPDSGAARACALVSWILSTLRFVIFREVSACSTWKEPPPPHSNRWRRGVPRIQHRVLP